MCYNFYEEINKNETDALIRNIINNFFDNLSPPRGL